MSPIQRTGTGPRKHQRAPGIQYSVCKLSHYRKEVQGETDSSERGSIKSSGSRLRFLKVSFILHSSFPMIPRNRNKALAQVFSSDSKSEEQKCTRSFIRNESSGLITFSTVVPSSPRRVWLSHQLGDLGCEREKNTCSAVAHNSMLAFALTYCRYCKSARGVTVSSVVVPLVARSSLSMAPP